jgi:hypothetical protein
MWWIDLFLVGGVVSNKFYHAVDYFFFDVMLDGFEST